MGCTGGTKTTEKTSLAELVGKYLRGTGCCICCDIEEFKGSRLKEAIKKAAQARLGRGKRRNGTRKLHSHQRWLKQKTADEAKRILLHSASIKEIKACKNFDQLHEVIKTKLQIPFAGELYWYDTAFRIGISIGIMPKKVYLHAGTRTGAIALGLYSKGSEILDMDEVLKKYPEFSDFKPYQVEDFLCIYKDVLHKFRRCSGVKNK